MGQMAKQGWRSGILGDTNIHMKPHFGRALFLTVLAPFLLLVSTGCKSTPVAEETRKEYSFWPPAPDHPRIQFLRTFNSSADVTKEQSHTSEIMYGRQQVLALTKPYGVAMWQGKIYVCDVRSKGLTILDCVQHLAKVIGVGGTVEIGKSIDIAVAPDGFKYVIDGSNNAIAVVDPQDHVTQRFTIPDLKPVGIALYQNELYVTDFTAKCVKVLDRSNGAMLRRIGQPGEEGEMLGPLGVGVDPAGTVYVSDTIACKVLRFARDGKFLDSFSRAGNNAGDLARPKYFAFDSKGNLYIADAAFANVQVFDDKQKLLGFFGSPGDHPGAMNLPVGVFVDESPDDLAVFREYVHPAFQIDALLLVTNQFGGQRVNVYAVGQLKPGKTMADIAAGRAKFTAGTTLPTTRTSVIPPATRPSADDPAR